MSILVSIKIYTGFTGGQARDGEEGRCPPSLKEFFRFKLQAVALIA